MPLPWVSIPIYRLNKIPLEEFDPSKFVVSIPIYRLNKAEQGRICKKIRQVSIPIYRLNKRYLFSAPLCKGSWLRSRLRDCFCRQHLLNFKLDNPPVALRAPPSVHKEGFFFLTLIYSFRGRGDSRIARLKILVI